jgi:MSHA biogenesis protein MshO
VRVSDPGDHLELLQTRSGARYLSADDGVPDGLVLSFDKGSNSFTAVGMPNSFAQVRAGDYVVVYNLGQGFEPANAYALADTGVTRCPTTQTAGPAMSTQTINGQKLPTATITLAGNPFALQDTALQSPLQRFQVISGPVSFYCAAGPDGRPALWRAWNYPIAATQAVPAAGERALVATGLTSCRDLFSYGAGAQRTGLVRIALELRGRADNPASIRLVHQVHVDNTP